mmetsp:Transcript_109777/g.321404  ORF Transcript_109777/g.321404 Transcript_109777/m.321404 type:complete len:265 (-) Transcript_109777:563-1357(-)
MESGGFSFARVSSPREPAEVGRSVTCQGVRPFRPWICMSAPAWRRWSTTWLMPLNAAWWRGVHPSMSWPSGFPLARTRCMMSSSWPFLAAMWRGPRPLPLRRSKRSFLILPVAFCERISASIRPNSPKKTAVVSGVQPDSSLKLMSARLANSFWMPASFSVDMSRTRLMLAFCSSSWSSSSKLSGGLGSSKREIVSRLRARAALNAAHSYALLCSMGSARLWRSLAMKDALAFTEAYSRQCEPEVSTWFGSAFCSMKSTAESCI